MKKLLTTLAFIGMMGAAQAQCDSVLNYEIDQFSGDGNWSNKEPILLTQDGEKGMQMILLMADDKHKTLIWVATSTEAGCVDNGKKVELVLSDGTRMTLYNEGKFNCKGKATMYFGGIFGKRAEMQRLSTTAIDKIRVHGSTTLHDEQFAPETAEYFKNVFKCLIEQREK